MDKLTSIYSTKPEFVRNILHLNFFNTKKYYKSRMSGISNLKISKDLMFAFWAVPDVTAYSIEDGIYKFELKTNFIGLPYPIPFPLLFCALSSVCFESKDIDDMYNRIYESKRPLLLKLAEEFRDSDIALSNELFDFVKRKECNTKKTWQINEILSGSWNYTLLALNKAVWETAFDINYLSQLFKDEKNELNAIDEGRLKEEEYHKYLRLVDELIHKKLT